MSNFPATQSIGSDLQAALGQSKVQSTMTGGVQHLRFKSVADEGDNTGGMWTYGKDAVECSNDEILINTQSIRHGWHMWVDNELDDVMVPFVQSLPDEPAPVKDAKGKIKQASEARELQGMFIDTDEPFPIQFATSSYGGRAGIDDLLNQIRARAVTEPTYLYPVVTLDHAEPYANPHKAGQMVYNPKFNIVRWCDMEGNPEEGPAKALPAVEEPEAAEAVEEAAPTRRRRRTA